MQSMAESRASLVVTVDVEMDCAWAKPNRIALRNLRTLTRFQDLCDAFDVVPTYLLTYECTAMDEALSVLLPIAETRRCEVGHHLHVWTTPPFQDEGIPGIDTAWLHAYQYMLPDSLFMEKAECLLRAIETAYHLRPVSHRAGRWAVDRRTLLWLRDNGFAVDTSVVPCSDLAGPIADAGGPCCFDLPAMPYLWDLGSGHTVLEVPLTVSVPGEGLRRFLAAMLRTEFPGAACVARLLRKTLKVGKPLRPYPQYPAGTLSAIANAALRNGAQVLNLMLHSSELAPACSPSSSTVEQTQLVWNRLAEVLAYARQRGLVSRKLSELGDVLRQTNSVSTGVLPESSDPHP